jgi:hypothetical protein
MVAERQASGPAWRQRTDVGATQGLHVRRAPYPRRRIQAQRHPPPRRISRPAVASLAWKRRCHGWGPTGKLDKYRPGSVLPISTPFATIHGKRESWRDGVQTVIGRHQLAPKRENPAPHEKSRVHGAGERSSALSGDLCRAATLRRDRATLFLRSFMPSGGNPRSYMGNSPRDRPGRLVGRFADANADKSKVRLPKGAGRCLRLAPLNSRRRGPS